MMRNLFIIILCLFLTNCDEVTQDQTLQEAVTESIIEQVSLLDVVDGDTIHVRRSDGSLDTIRIIGLDAPETIHSPNGPECYADESSTAMENLVQGPLLELETASGHDRDKYNRLLRYVLSSKIDIGATMIDKGFAKHLSYFHHPKAQMYDKLEINAKLKRLGLWGECFLE